MTAHCPSHPQSHANICYSHAIAAVSAALTPGTNSSSRSTSSSPSSATPSSYSSSQSDTSPLSKRSITSPSVSRDILALSMRSPRYSSTSASVRSACASRQPSGTERPACRSQTGAWHGLDSQVARDACISKYVPAYTYTCTCIRAGRLTHLHKDSRMHTNTYVHTQFTIACCRLLCV